MWTINHERTPAPFYFKLRNAELLKHVNRMRFVQHLGSNISKDIAEEPVTADHHVYYAIINAAINVTGFMCVFMWIAAFNQC